MKHKTVDTLFQSALEGWKADTTRAWTVFSVMSVINTGLMASLSLGGRTTAGANGQSTVIRVIVCAIGVVLCTFWWGIQRRFVFWCGYWDDRLAKLEAALTQTDSDDAISTTLEVWQARAECGLPRPGLSTRKANWCMPLLFMGAWGVVAGTEILQMNGNVAPDRALALLVVLAGPFCLWLGYKCHAHSKFWSSALMALGALSVSGWAVVLMRRLWWPLH